MSTHDTQASWSEAVASLCADALVENGLVREEFTELAAKVITEEIWMRLSIGDNPPIKEPPYCIA